MKWSNDILNNIFLGENYGNNWSSNYVSIDTRTIKPGDLFIAIKGNNFDGNNFINEAYESGATASIVSNKSLIHDKMPLFLVQDSLLAMHEMAKFARNKLQNIIAITGSVGKTTVKEMITEILKHDHSVYCNKGNFNNHIGLPLTIINAPEKNVEYTILEMGMSNMKEISLLSNIAKPNIAVITNIGSAHIANLKSQNNIALAKAEIFNGMQKNGIVVLNTDDKFYELLKNETLKFPNIKKIITFGSDKNADFQFLESECNKIKIRAIDKIIEYNFTHSGLHLIYNTMISLAVVYALGLDVKKYADHLVKFSPLIGRGKNINLTLKNNKNILLIDDSYNASPESMIASLINYSNYNGRKIVVLADMLELGDESLSMHLKLLPYLSKIDVIITLGEMMNHLSNSLPLTKQKFHFKDINDIIKKIDDIILDKDNILIKGSNSMNLNLLAKHLITI